MVICQDFNLLIYLSCFLRINSFKKKHHFCNEIYSYLLKSRTFAKKSFEDLNCTTTRDGWQKQNFECKGHD